MDNCNLNSQDGFKKTFIFQFTLCNESSYLEKRTKQNLYTNHPMKIFSIPMWAIYCSLFIAGLIFFGIFVFFVVRRYFHHELLKKHHDLAGFIFATFGVLYSVFLGFTIVNSQDHYGQIISQIDQEAYLSADLFRMAFPLPEKIRVQMQNGITEYIKSVIEDEWPLMYKKMESPITLKKLEEMWVPYYSFTPGTEHEKLWLTESLRVLVQYNSARLKRIYSSWDSLGGLSWAALVSGGIILMSFLFFFGTENAFAHILMNSVFIGYFGFMLFVVYSLDNPFRPPQKINPTAYEVVYNYYKTARGRSISPEDSQNGLFEHFRTEN